MFAAIVQSIALPPALRRPPRRAEGGNGRDKVAGSVINLASWYFALALSPALLWLWEL